MPNDVIVSVDQVTAAWLTDVLTISGALESGAVESFEFDTGEERLSTNARLKVKYAAESRGEMPQKLFLKMVHTDQNDGFFGPSEVYYYIRDYVGVWDAPLIRHYDAAYSAEQGRYHVLMDDVSETHIVAIDKTPTLEYGLALADGLAAMHARWWDRLGDAPIPSAASIRRFVSIAEPGAEHILAACADQLKPHWPEMIRELFKKHPQAMIERTRDGNGFTLIHGDVNCFNVLVPTAGDRPIYIIDRQPFDWSLTTWLGVYDLAYVMVLDWDIEIRRTHEQAILRRYHEQLIAHGVSGYSWEQLFEDYRLAAPMIVYIPTEWNQRAFNAETMWIWLPMLQRALTAIDDLDCVKLW
jgi:ecdysteroid kinase